MFNLNALVILTIFNLIALVQIAANILAPARLQRGPILGAAAICLATSLTGLAMAMLVPSPVVGVASVTIAALVNLFAVLGTGLDRLSDPGSTEAIRHLRGLARIAIIGSPHEPAFAGAAPLALSAPTRSKPVLIRAPAQPPALPGPDPLPKLLEAANRLALPALRPTRPQRSATHIPTSAKPLAPRQNYTVPRRPNRLPTSSLAFLLSVDPKDAPDIFADARASMSELSALAHRVRLVSDPRRPVSTPQSTNVWPTTFSEPDPAWRTSYGRLPALAAGV
ncbi:MAG TPA: hypothetical protein VH599_10635 [Ktedonobacterales bacterium]|jgi:hypothetical protein